jgi:hypothetical protein
LFLFFGRLLLYPFVIFFLLAIVLSTIRFVVPLIFFYFDTPQLKDYVVISPLYMVDVMKSFVTGTVCLMNYDNNTLLSPLMT